MLLTLTMTMTMTIYQLKCKALLYLNVTSQFLGWRLDWMR